MVLDLFSKYGWNVPLKDKKGETVTQAFKTIFEEGRKPQYVWTDKGKKYYNKHLKDVLEKHNITLYQPKMSKNLVFVKDETVQSKPRCGYNLLSRVIQHILIRYQK